MSVEVKVPELGESVQEVQIVEWLKREGEPVRKDEDLVQIDSEKATVEIPSPATGTLTEILKADGAFCSVGEVIGQVETEKAASPEEAPERTKPAGAKVPEDKREKGDGKEEREAVPSTAIAEAEQAPSAAPEDEGGPKVMPAAERALAEFGLSPGAVEPTGPGGRLLKEDVLRHAEEQRLKRQPPDRKAAGPEPPKKKPAKAGPSPAGREEEVVPMSMIRAHIAQRLVQAQQQAALLTTFNEADMSAVIELRRKYRDRFQEEYDVKLGFMSFFVKATAEALKRYPQLNAEIRDRNIVYRNYYDIGVAIGSRRGLVVPVLRNVEQLGFAEIERAIGEFAQRAESGKLEPEELEGGTFTISNGGIYGSMLSTPIVNPPQSGILGLHAIQDRPVAREGNVVIRPMMYLALTYDHRIVDGREAVSFLRAIKERIEDPASIMLEI